MTGILLCCTALIVAVSCLYLVLARPDLVVRALARLLRGGDPWGWRSRLRARLLHVTPPKLVEPWYPTDVAEAEARDLYPPEAPDPVDEHFITAPRVVAGQDLDDSLLVAEWQQAYADYRNGADIFAGAIHEPSPEVRK